MSPTKEKSAAAYLEKAEKVSELRRYLKHLREGEARNILRYVDIAKPLAIKEGDAETLLGIARLMGGLRNIDSFHKGRGLPFFKRENECLGACAKLKDPEFSSTAYYALYCLNAGAAQYWRDDNKAIAALKSSYLDFPKGARNLAAIALNAETLRGGFNSDFNRMIYEPNLAKSAQLAFEALGHKDLHEDWSINKESLKWSLRVTVKHQCEKVLGTTRVTYNFNDGTSFSIKRLPFKPRPLYLTLKS